MLGGFVDDQRFSNACAQAWCGKLLDVGFDQILASDGLKPGFDLPLAMGNLDVWCKAFNMHLVGKVHWETGDEIDYWLSL